MLRRLLFGGLTVVAVGIVGCASSLQTRKEPDAVRSSIEAVLRNQGFDSVAVLDEAQAWRVHGEMHRSFPYTERVFAVTQEPSLRMDPGGNNITVFEEKIDPAHATTLQRTQAMDFRADVTLAKNGPNRQLSVTVQGPQALKSDKYRDIRWLEGEPPSPLQLEEAIVRELRQVVTD